MPQYMLSIHMVEGEERAAPTEEQMEQHMARIGAVEDDLRAAGAWMFSGRLSGPESATVVRKVDGQRVISDGPFAESKEHLGGFYVINAADLDEALSWGERTSEATGAPIEVWPFSATADE